MVIANAAKVPGQTLRDYRELYGVSRRALADRLQKHRNTLVGWEAASELDATRAEQYRRGVDAIVRERLGGTAA